jgi:hypothetical protein
MPKMAQIPNLLSKLEDLIREMDRESNSGAFVDVYATKTASTMTLTARDEFPKEVDQGPEWFLLLEELVDSSAYLRLRWYGSREKMPPWMTGVMYVSKGKKLSMRRIHDALRQAASAEWYYAEIGVVSAT